MKSRRFKGKSTRMYGGRVKNGSRLAGHGDFFGYADSEEARKRANGRYSVAANIRSAIVRLRDFTGGESLPFNRLTAGLVMCFDDYLKGRGLRSSTRSLYLQLLGGLYEGAVREGLTADRQPFGGVRRGRVYHRQPKLTEDEVAKVLSMEVKAGSWEERAQDVAAMSYHLCGMPPVDLIYLRWKQIDLQNNLLTFSRRKTEKPLTVSLTPHARKVVLKYRGQGWGGYVFPFITSDDREVAHGQYASARRQLARAIGKLGMRAGITTKVTLYAFRRSWATIAHHDYQAPTSVVSVALCHGSELITERYVQRLGTNKQVLHMQEVMSKGLEQKSRKLKKECPTLRYSGTFFSLQI